MKNRNDRRVLLFLCSVLLAASVLPSCGETPAADETGETQEIISETAAETEAVTQVHYTANIPDMDFGGAEFRILGPDPTVYPSMVLEADVAEESGDTVLDAIYKRNMVIEEKYNINFVADYAPDYAAPRKTLRSNAMADDSTYQLIMEICREAFPDSVNGYVLPYSEIPYLDMTQPWYMQNINEQMSVAGKNILVYSDECFNAYTAMLCVFFNKQLLTQYDLDDPYQLVKDGKWTTDVFYNMAEEVIRDVNGDMVFNDQDIFGIVGEEDMFYASMWIGAGSSMVTKDKNDIPVYTAPTDEKLLTILAELNNRLKKDGFFLNGWQYYMDVGDQRTRDVRFFTQSQALFTVAGVGNAAMMRSMEADFGILPLPKHDEAQENYNSRMCDGWIHVVPNTAQNKELVGTVMETLAVETRNYLMPAYFEVALTDKYARDNESEEMLSIIFDNITVDLGDTVWFEPLRDKLVKYILTGQDGFASKMESFRTSFEKNLEKTLEALEQE